MPEVEDATLEGVAWLNHRRLLGPIGHLRPAKFEAARRSHRSRPGGPAAVVGRAVVVAPVSDLADALGQRLAAVSALAGRLARAGLLRRSEDPNDRRRVRLELTDHAERLLAAVDDRSAARFAAILGQMSPQGRHALAIALEELVRLLHDATDQHARSGPRPPR